MLIPTQNVFSGSVNKAALTSLVLGKAQSENDNIYRGGQYQEVVNVWL